MWRTTRCQSTNYHQGANFCQTNFQTNVSSPDLNTEKHGWINSARADWDKVKRKNESNYSIRSRITGIQYQKEQNLIINVLHLWSLNTVNVLYLACRIFGGI